MHRSPNFKLFALLNSSHPFLKWFSLVPGWNSISHDLPFESFSVILCLSMRPWYVQKRFGTHWIVLKRSKYFSINQCNILGNLPFCYSWDCMAWLSYGIQLVVCSFPIMDVEEFRIASLVLLQWRHNQCHLLPCHVLRSIATISLVTKRLLGQTELKIYLLFETLSMFWSEYLMG